MATTLTGAASNPDYRKRRAKKAAQARHSLSTYVKQVVDRAPELTPEQRDRLAAILRPSDGEAAAQ